LSRKTFKLPSRERYKALALGIPVFMIGIGYLGATQYIPVSLAVLIFYTSPFLVAIISRFTENEKITIIRMLAIFIAFIGLSLALEIRSVNTLDWRGIMFGFVASIGGTIFVTFSSLTLKTADPQKVNFHCLAAGTALFATFLLISGGPTHVIPPPCLLKLTISGVFLAFAYVTFFNGLEIIGGFKTSMLMNMEPIITIILAAVLLGEQLALLQLVGAAMVIAGIMVIGGRVRNAVN
jgi:drug/metabolite transporter (DMT)-like permease